MENATFITFTVKTSAPAVSDGVNVSWNSQDVSGNQRTIKCCARHYRNTFPRTSPAPGQILMLFFTSNRASSTFRVSVPIKSTGFPGTKETRMTAQAPCIMTGMS